ncbi:MAG: repeat-associated core domain protein [Phycisphaerales bacterium]|nr:repeat-associated core domain protein [Phycisphaerales bacterium]MDB5357912.1 repeat-associated core domain protein [Phycisphaerales bacterium]
MRLRETDLAVSGGGLFGHQRVYGNQPPGAYDGPNGFNWWVRQFPTASSVGPSTVAITFDSNRTYWFDKVGSSYVPRYSFLNVSLTEDTTANTFTFVETSDVQTEITVLNSLAATTNPGQFVSHTDWRGIQTTVASRTGSQINELQRTFTTGGTTSLESLLYAYFTSGAIGKLQTVTYRRQVNSGGWTPVALASYAYYDGSTSFGSANDLKSAAQQLPDGSGGWNTVGVDFYRYWLAGDTKGFAHGLKMHFGPEAYRLMFNDGVDPETALDPAVMPYVDHYFEYDPASWSVTKEVSAVCPSCPGGGTTSDAFAYTPNPRNPSPGFNVWSMKTVQSLPDSSQIVVYTNYAGQPMLKVNVDPAGTSMWATFYRFGTGGQAIWEAQPSAVALPASLSTLEAYDDLLHYNGTTYQYLNTTGLIKVIAYYTTTDLPNGKVAGYVSTRSVQHGQSGTPVAVEAYTYTSHSDSGTPAITIYPIATRVTYPSDSGTTPSITISYTYDSWQSSSNYLLQKTTYLPLVSTAQNGSNVIPTIVEVYDANGNLTSRTDERGTVNTYTYGGVILGAISQQTLNVVSGGTDPGMNLVSDFTYDDQGRLTQTLGASHSVVISGSAATVRPATWNVYLPSAKPSSVPWPVDQTLTGNGYLNGSTYTLVNPYAIANSDKGGRRTDQITAARSSGSGPLTASDASVAQSQWESWSSTQYNLQHRTVSSRVYHLIPTPSGIGSSPTNYGETDFGYDALERQNRVTSPGGTITRTVWTTPQWVAAVWVGTDDTGATDSNPSHGGVAPNNMVQVTGNVYDNGSAGGDGNLTAVSQFPSAVGTDERVTFYTYDWRDRQTSTTGEINVYAAYTYDNLDRLYQTDRHDTGSSGNLIGRSATSYDDRNRVFQRTVIAVDPSNGSMGNELTTNIWYDEGGNFLQQIEAGAGQVFSKSKYNGMGWVTNRYVGYNLSGTSWAQANTVINDIILSQSDFTYDNSGNVISRADSERLNDATGAGALSTGTQPKARISYMAMWYDGIDRPIASGNYGATASFTRPTLPPASGTSVLVNQTTYDASGRIGLASDPAGITAKTSYDAAGRVTQTVEDYSTGSGHLNRTTNYAYTLDNLVATLTAVNTATGDQTTTYAYGTTLSDSGVARNDLLHYVDFPDSVSGSDRITYTYNRLGQQASITDQRSNVRTLCYDKLGRLTDDGAAVTTGTDSSILRISATYEVRGMLQTLTSFDNATPGNGTPKNQVQFDYNDFGQLVTEWQEHGGVKGGSTLNVQYGHDSGSSGSNEIRLNALTYPNGRIITYSYGTPGGINETLNRVSEIKDGSTSLAAYSYLGLGRVIQIDSADPHLRLDMWGQTSGLFSGFDIFGRVTDQRWLNSSTAADLDRYQYGYDYNSNRKYKANLVGTAAVAPSPGFDEYYTHDNLNRLLTMQRGTLNTNVPPSGIAGAITRETDYMLDPTDNWSQYATATAGSIDLSQTRAHNTVNEITGFTTTTGTHWSIPSYDLAGNTLSFPKPSALNNSYTAVYDAWNRMVQVKDGTTSIAAYQYDGRHRRISKMTPSETRHFYYTNRWQDIEHRVNGLTSMDQQHVWGVRYIDELVCRDRTVSGSDERIYACQDANFNVTALVDSSGIVKQRFVYEAYGVADVLDSTWVLASDAYVWMPRFQGGPYDVSTCLYSFRNRDYHPWLGRWLRRDPVGYIDGANLYAAYHVARGQLDPLGLAGVDHQRQGKDQFQGFEARFDELCENCCDTEVKRRACFINSARLANRLVATWEKSYGKGRNTSNDEVGGYLCWDWANAFNRANPASTSSLMCSKSKVIDKKDDPTNEVHVFARFCACTCDDKHKSECCLDVDDGWFDEDFVHDPKENWYTKDGGWKDDDGKFHTRDRQSIPVVKNCKGC